MSRLSKQKGAEFERKICKQLSRWIDSNREDLFWRSAMSGGRATLKSNKGEVSGQAGDITSIDKIGQWFKTMTTNDYIRSVKANHWKPFSGKLWQRNYHEHIIRNEESFGEIVEYIVNNPIKWAEDNLYIAP